jgi:hydroxymethylpyrimidine/phosphomethylpyrimidine kinase
MQVENDQSYDRVLTIATSDSGGGAGVQADLKTISALGCYGMSAFAALTAQNTCEVRAIHEVPPGFLKDQIDVVVEDIGVDAVKIGMLFNGKLMEAVAESIEKHHLQNIVLDPVMVSQSGAKLIQDEAVKTLREQLFPLSDVITPNLPEAERLLEYSIEDQQQVEQAACDLLEMGPKAVLLKGGHFRENQSIDCLVLSKPDNKSGEEVFWFEAERIQTDNTHGTGCTLSSAIASGLAKGDTLPEAVDQAKVYITGAIKAGSHYNIGNGGGPLHHFHKFWS